MRPEPGPLAGRAGPAPPLRITWLEATVPSEAAPPSGRAKPGGPGWAPYLLAGLAGVLLLLATLGWSWWQPVGLWLEAAIMTAGPRP